MRFTFIADLPNHDVCWIVAFVLLGFDETVIEFHNQFLIGTFWKMYVSSHCEYFTVPIHVIVPDVVNCVQYLLVHGFVKGVVGVSVLFHVFSPMVKCLIF